MVTPHWVEYLRTNPDAWADFVAWLDAERVTILEMTPATWEEELIRQGSKKLIDNIRHRVTLDQKEATKLQLHRINSGRE